MTKTYTKVSAFVAIVTATVIGWSLTALASPTSDAITAGADAISDEVILVLPSIIGGSAVLFAAFLGIKALFNLFKRAVA